MNEKDTANLIGETLTGHFHYDWPQPHDEHFELVRCNPADADYWAAFAGRAWGFKVIKGLTCLASVQSMLRLQAEVPVANGGWLCSNSVYVIWKPKNFTPSAWKRWEAKWSKRTSLPVTA